MKVEEFSSEQYEVAYPDGVEHHWWHLARNEIVRRACVALDPRATAVLDVGCGRGIVVGYLRAKGFDCAGVEVGSVVPVAAAEGHVRMRTNALELPISERERIDVILLLDVLEHVQDPSSLLRSLVHAFPNLAHVIATVPAHPELWSNHDEYYGHYRRYTMPDIAEIGPVLGAMRSSTYFFRLLYPLVWFMARLKIEREVALKAPGKISRWLHKVIAKAFVLEVQLLPRRLRGTSILAVFSVEQSAR